MPEKENRPTTVHSAGYLSVPNDFRLLHAVFKNRARAKLMQCLSEYHQRADNPDDENPGLHLSQIATLCKMNKRTVHVNLADLEQDRLVKYEWITKHVKGRPVWTKVYVLSERPDLSWLRSLKIDE